MAHPIKVIEASSSFNDGFDGIPFAYLTQSQQLRLLLGYEIDACAVELPSTEPSPLFARKGFSSESTMNDKATPPVTVNYDAMITELLTAARSLRERIRQDPYQVIGHAPITTAQHLTYYHVGVTGPRQSGKTLWAVRTIDADTIVVCVNKLFQRAFRDSLEEMVADRADVNLSDNVLTYRDCLDMLVRGESKTLNYEPLRRVKRVIVDEADYMATRATSKRFMMGLLSSWSRLGGQVPDIITLN